MTGNVKKSKEIGYNLFFNGNEIEIVETNLYIIDKDKYFKLNSEEDYYVNHVENMENTLDSIIKKIEKKEPFYIDFFAFDKKSIISSWNKILAEGQVEMKVICVLNEKYTSMDYNELLNEIYDTFGTDISICLKLKNGGKMNVCTDDRNTFDIYEKELFIEGIVNFEDYFEYEDSDCYSTDYSGDRNSLINYITASGGINYYDSYIKIYQRNALHGSKEDNINEEVDDTDFENPEEVFNLLSSFFSETPSLKVYLLDDVDKGYVLKNDETYYLTEANYIFIAPKDEVISNKASNDNLNDLISNYNNCINKLVLN
jgi:hypothetical protein